MRLKTTAELLAASHADLVMYCQDLHIEHEQLQRVEKAAENLRKQNGRHNTEYAYSLLVDALNKGK